jgi:hypothetical protein
MSDDESYRKQAEIVYLSLKDMQKHATTMQAEYGKWMINTLYLLHGGAIAGLLAKAAPGVTPIYLSSLWWFVGGIVCSMCAALAAWWNFTFAARIYYQSADYRMLTDKAHWPKIPRSMATRATMILGMLAGLSSIACLVLGAYSVSQVWR